MFTDDDFVYEFSEDWVSYENRDDQHPFCLVCGNILDEWDSACDCDYDCAYAPRDFDDEDV